MSGSLESRLAAARQRLDAARAYADSPEARQSTIEARADHTRAISEAAYLVDSLTEAVRAVRDREAAKHHAGVLANLGPADLAAAAADTLEALKAVPPMSARAQTLTRELVQIEARQAELATSPPPDPAAVAAATQARETLATLRRTNPMVAASYQDRVDGLLEPSR